MCWGSGGITVKVTANDQLFLPKYDGAIEFRYAHTALPEQEVEGGSKPCWN